MWIWIGEQSLELIEAIHPGYKQAYIAVHFYPTFLDHGLYGAKENFGIRLLLNFWASGRFRK
jgi:hypothetical protein